MPTDHDLLDRFLARDDDAFTALVERHGPLVFGTCRRQLAGADAEDAFQAVFIALAARAPALRDHPCLPAWLHRAAFHIARRQGAAMTARRRRERDAVMGRPSAGDDAMSAERSDLQAHALAALDAAIAALPERYRLPVVLHHLNGRSQAEVAQRLGLSENALAKRLSRARERLRIALGRAGVPAATALLALGGASLSAQVPPALIAAASAASRAPVLAANVTTTATTRAAQAFISGDRHAMLIAHAKIGALVALLIVSGVAGLSLARHQAADPPIPSADPPPATVTDPTPPWVGSAAWDTMSTSTYDLERAFLLSQSTPGQLPDPVGRPSGTMVRIGALTTPTDHDRKRSLDWGREAGFHLGPYPLTGTDGTLMRLAEGQGLGGATATGSTLALVTSPVLSLYQYWSPYSLSRDGAIITLVMDSWADSAARRMNSLSRHTVLIDLGTLAGGTYSLRTLHRAFSAESPGGSYAMTAVQHASVAFTVGAGSTPATIAWADLRDAPEAIPPMRDDRRIPWRWKLRFIPETPQRSDPHSTRIAIAPMATVTAGRWSNADDIPDMAHLSAEERQAGWCAIVVGPIVRGHLTLRDVFGTRHAPDAPLSLRMDLWIEPGGNHAQSLQPARSLLIIPLPSGGDPLTPIAVDVMYAVHRRDTAGAYRLHSLSGQGHATPGWSDWRPLEAFRP